MSLESSSTWSSSDNEGTTASSECTFEEIEFTLTDIQSADFLGFRLCGSRSSGVFVNFVSSTCDTSSGLNVGDQILRINNLNLTGLTPDQVVRILRTSLSVRGLVKIYVCKRLRQIIEKCQYPNSSVAHSLSDSHLSMGHHPLGNYLIEKRHSAIRESYAQVHKMPICALTNEAFEASFSPPTVDFADKEDGYTYALEEDNRIKLIADKQPISNKTSDCRRFSPRKLFQYWTRNDNILNVSNLGSNVEDDDDDFHLTKPNLLYAEDFSVCTTLINGLAAQSSRKEKRPNEELPLICFDHCNQPTPSPGEFNRLSNCTSETDISSMGSGCSKMTEGSSRHCSSFPGDKRNNNTCENNSTRFSLMNRAMSFSPETPTMMSYKL